MENTDNNLSSEIAALRTQVFTLLVALIIDSGTVTVYLYRQASTLRKDIDQIEPQAKQIINAFNQNQKLMVNFVNSLVAYGQTHPEFRPVLLKYGITPPPAGVAAPAAPKK